MWRKYKGGDDESETCLEIFRKNNESVIHYTGVI
jgi:hypothetical protein